VSLPASTVRTFLFSDIEGSTRLIQALADDYPRLLAEHRALIGAAVNAHHGRIFGTEGDALFCVFDAPAAAIGAAADAQRALAGHDWPAGGQIKVRMGVHSGPALATGDDYVGLTLHEVARLMSAGHGGQVLVSGATRQLVVAGLPADLELRDLGEHRLKDLSLPERLYQLLGPGLATDFPPLRSLSARPNNLPVQLTSFVGRAELADAQASLAGTRLLTLTGTGGTGKTRLALQLAAAASDGFADGVYFVPLDAVTDPALVPAAIASAVSLAAGGNLPPEQRVADFLRDRRVLLVLDNFEQLIAGAPYVGQLLREAAELVVIVTSRVLLRVYGETEFPVPPLGLPAATERGPWSAERAARYEAVRLFVERAMAAQPSFRLADDNAATVIDIVRRLDGLPLAIELAAARVRVFSVEAVAARLDQRLRLLTGGARDRPERQQTLRGAIDWSYDLLEAADRRLFDRFSVFAGGACLAQAEPVCGPPTELGTDVLDGLSSLAEKSLVRGAPTSTEDPRFLMLATIREYGLEKLAVDGDADSLRQRHAETFAALVEEAEPHVTGSDASRWLDRLELDHDNVRAAFEWAIAADLAELAARLLAAIWRAWQIRGHLFEARQLADRVLAMAGAADLPAALRARAFGAGGSICYWQGDYVDANRYYSPALAAARQSGDRAAIALALYNFSFAPLDYKTATRRELLLAAIPSLEESAALYAEMGDQAGLADTNWGLGFSLLAQSNLEAAEAHAQAAFDIALSLADPFRIGWTGHLIGTILANRGQIEQAQPILRQAFDKFRATGDQGGILMLLLDYALLAQAAGDLSRYWRLAGAFDAIRANSGIALDVAFFEVGVDSFFLHVPLEPADPAALADWQAGRLLSIEQAIALALETPAPVATGGR
jgi:predicted ATPase/class 3 adenylate cyclase